MPSVESTSPPDEEFQRCLEDAFADHRRFRARMCEAERSPPRENGRDVRLAGTSAKPRVIARPQ
jgi:hypothetical protein